MPLVRYGQPCADCAQTATPWVCTHTRNETPKWKSKRREIEYAWLWQGDTGTLTQENLAISQDLSRYALSDEDRAIITASPPCPLIHVPGYLVMGGDAALGGKCEFAIHIGYWRTPRSYVYLYSDSFHVTSGRFEVQDLHINAALDYVRSIGPLARTPILVCIENSPGNVGEQVSRVFKTRINEVAGETYLIARESGAKNERRLGIDKNAGLDNDMTTTLTELLRPDATGQRGEILFSTLFQTFINRQQQPHEQASAPERERTACISQLCSWELQVVGEQGRMRLIWNGKRHGNDDRTIAALYALHFSRSLSISTNGYYASFFARARRARS